MESDLGLHCLLQPVCQNTKGNTVSRDMDIVLLWTMVDYIIHLIKRKIYGTGELGHKMELSCVRDHEI